MFVVEEKCMNKVYVIGGANIDIFATCHNEIIIRDSNPANMTMSFGGVAHNIAKNIANLGEHIYFITCLSDDHFGKMIHQNCIDSGFDMQYSFFKNDYPSSMYLAIMDKNRDMYLASSDMRIVEGLKYEDLEQLKDCVDDEDYLIIDTNLDEEVISKIYQNFKGIKVSDAISANKVHKLKNNLTYVDILKLNMIEAETIINHELDSDEKVVAALRTLRAKGVKEVLITTKKGAYLASDKIYYFEHDAYDKDVVNTTGAGDAFLAAYTYAHKNNFSINKRVCFALTQAILTVRSNDTVADIDCELVEKTMRNIHFKVAVLYTF